MERRIDCPVMVSDGESVGEGKKQKDMEKVMVSDGESVGEGKKQKHMEKARPSVKARMAEIVAEGVAHSRKPEGSCATPDNRSVTSLVEGKKQKVMEKAKPSVKARMEEIVAEAVARRRKPEGSCATPDNRSVTSPVEGKKQKVMEKAKPSVKARMEEIVAEAFARRRKPEGSCATPNNRSVTSPVGNSGFNGMANLEIKDKIKRAIAHIINHVQDERTLVQFWAQITLDGTDKLTTRNQPFNFKRIDDKLCEYRTNSKDCSHNVGGKRGKNLGLPGPVFLYQLDQSGQIAEFPQDEDLYCNVRASLALPVFEASGQTCVGVLELATTAKDSSLILEQRHVFDALKKVDLKCSVVHTCSSTQDKEKEEALAAALDEIRKVLVEMVCRVHHKILCAQAWFQCSLCKAVIDVGLIGVSDRKLVTSTVTNCTGKKYGSLPSGCNTFNLKEEQGVDGRAFLYPDDVVLWKHVTKHMLYCPLLQQHELEGGLSGCFAVCLQSRLTGNDDFMLEVFLPANHDYCENLDTSNTVQLNTLSMVLGTMTQSFQTFKLASGKGFGEQLTVNVIDFNIDEKAGYAAHRITIPLHGYRVLQNEEMGELDISYQQSMDPMNKRKNVGSVQQMDTGLVHSQKNQPQRTTGIQFGLKDHESDFGMKLDDAARSLGSVDQEQILPSSSGVLSRQRPLVTVSDRGPCDSFDAHVKESCERLHRNKRLHRKISFNDLERHFEMNLEDAADSLNVSRSTLKRICRKYGINRWPTAMLQKDRCSLPTGSIEDDAQQKILQSKSDLTSEDASATNAQIKPHDKRMVNADVVTVKAVYGSDTIKFGLSLSSGVAGLREQVAKRLNLEVGTYRIKYIDEDNDCILIACDEDLRYCIQTSELPDGAPLRLLLLPI